MYCNLLKQLADGAADEDVDILVKFECRTRTQHDTERCGDALLAYVVCLVLLNCRHTANGVVYVHVYRTLSAPWRAIYDRCAVVGNAYDRVVVVYQRASFDVLDPLVAVGALALSAHAKKHVSLTTVLNCSRVHEEGLVWCCTHGEYHHQCIVEAKYNVTVVPTCGNGEVVALGVALHEGAWCAELVHCQNLICAAVLAVNLECCAGAGESSDLAAAPRWLYTVVRCYFKKQIIGTFTLEWCKVG